MLFRDEDIARAAERMIADHGNGAEELARRRAAHARAKGLHASADAWERIRRLIAEHRPARRRPPDGRHAECC